MKYGFILFLPFALFHVTPCHTLLIYLQNSTTYQLSSLYSTVGQHLAFKTNVTITIVTKSDIQAVCSLDKVASSLSGKAVVYDGSVWSASLLLHGCVFNDFALALLFTHWAQQAGAVAVINIASHFETNYIDGRTAGFNKDVTIPYIITSKSNIENLVANAEFISTIELQPISKKEQKILQDAKRVYDGLIILNMIAYCVMTLLVGYIFVMEVHTLWLDRKINHRRAVLTFTCFINALLQFIWVVVDPNNYKLILGFPSLPIYFLSLSCTLIISLLVLKIWIRATGESFTHTNVKVVVIIINVWATVLAVMGVITAALWYQALVVAIYTVIAYGAACFTALGFIFYGRNIVKVMSNSYSNNNRGRVMSTKVTVTAVMNVMCCILVIVFQNSIAGGTVSVQVSAFLIFCTLLTTFLLLFFKLQRRKRRMSTHIHKDDRDGLDNSKNSSGGGRGGGGGGRSSTSSPTEFVTFAKA